MLAAIGASDVCLAKVLEAHYDAQAILAELGAPTPGIGELWAVWAAEIPSAQLDYRAVDERQGVLNGIKAWCSGAEFVTHALVTAAQGTHRRLLRIELAEPGVGEPARRWDAIGMARIVSGPLHFTDAVAEPVSEADAYLQRPGFWHGGAGIAACWYGAAVAIAETLRGHPRVAGDAHAAASLGWIDTQLSAAAALLRETAARIDASPQQPHIQAVLRLRSLIERVSTDIIDRVGRALGPGPLCSDRSHALRCADLSTFVRQSHAERDWEILGRQAAEAETQWNL